MRRQQAAFALVAFGHETECCSRSKSEFGQPIVTQFGVATEVPYLAVKSGDSEEAVAEWFEVDRQAIRDAIEFEERLAA